MKNTIAILFLFASIGYCHTIINSSQFIQKKSVKQIIFWGPSENELDSTMNDNDTEVYSDYYYYAGKANPILKELGIEIKDTTSRLIKINYGNDKVEIFKREQNSIGYIFTDGEQRPEFIKVVLTDVDLISKAKEFFHVK